MNRFIPAMTVLVLAMSLLHSLALASEGCTPIDGAGTESRLAGAVL